MKALQAFAAGWLLAAATCHAAPDPIAAQAVPVRLAAAAVDDVADLGPLPAQPPLAEHLLHPPPHAGEEGALNPWPA